MEERSSYDEDLTLKNINGFLERLKFSDEESVQVVSTNAGNNLQGFESWAVGKFMAEMKPNREAMYRVFRSLWFTKEDVDFVALNDEVIIVKFGCVEDRSRILNLTPWLFDNCLFSMLPFVKGQAITSHEFNMSPFGLRIYNIPLELMDRSTALDVGTAIGKVVAIDWKDRNGGWTEFMRLKIMLRVPVAVPTLGRGIRRNGVEIIEPKTILSVDREESRSDMRNRGEQFDENTGDKGLEEGSVSTSPMDRRSHKISRDSVGRFKNKRKRFRGLSGDCTDESPSKAVRRRLLENASPMKAVFTGFYGQADPNNKNLSWDMLRRVKGTVNEGWIVAGDFNAILNNAEKEGGRRKPRSSMEDFCKLIEEMELLDVKTKNGWFMWTNNRKGLDLVKERLDRFLKSENLVGNMPFLTTKIVRQSKSDHEAIIMDTLGSKPRDNNINPKTWFR
ncbi:hypothetical protein GOBAR_AA27918 [Gossypium barbadense]|uniref:DUF4283 domain-containing protein n=1 Tax=Gossypium barbadense TaxID=3634 RepID=A0A2P5WNZ5_GOSBA|nr:hypothetical protein GOBAR_AA27918 [Gossypium barbadense]